MKKIFSLLLLALFALSLGSCGLLDSDPECNDGETLIDGECIVDEDPTCETGEILVDGACVLDDTDPVCETGEILVDGECVLDDTDPVCETGEILVDGECVLENTDPVCGTGEELVDGECVLIDTRTPEEIVADLFVATWDGDLTHLDTLMSTMDFSTSMETRRDFYLEIEDFDGSTKIFNAIITDNFVYLTSGTVIHRSIALNVNGELAEFFIVLEETATGVIVYIEVDYLFDLISADDPNAAALFEMLGIADEWLMFKFDDSLDNLIEIEVLKDMLVDVFFEQVGQTFFSDLEEMLLGEIGLDPITVGMDLHGIVTSILDGDFENAEILINAVDVQAIITGVDETYVIPKLVELLADPVVIADLAASPYFLDAAALSTAIQSGGTLAYLETVDPVELSALIDYFIDTNNNQDPDLSAILDSIVAEELDMYLIVLFLTEAQEPLAGVPGLDEAGLLAAFEAMDRTDFDAWYMEMVDGEALATAIYEGQVSFDLFVTGLITTAPHSAAILANFSGVVFELEPYMIIIDDINYAFDNLIMFEQYFTFDYYLDIEVLDLEIVKTTDFDIETIVTFGNAAYSDLFVDVLNDVYFYLDGFETFDMPYIEHINCPLGEICETWEDYERILTNLDLLGNMEMTAIFNPYTMDSLYLEVNFTDLVNQIILLSEPDTPDPLNPFEPDTVIDFYYAVTVNEDGAVTVPTNVEDMNQMAEDLAKTALVMIGYDMLHDVEDYYLANPLQTPIDVGSNRFLDTYEGYVPANPAFDLSISYVGVVNTGSLLLPVYDYQIQLFWHDGTEVYDEPLLVSYLFALIGDEGLPTHAEYLTVQSKVNDANFSMTKLLLVFMLETQQEFPTP